MASAEEPLRESCEALSRRDEEWLIEHSDPEIEMHMRGVAGEPVRYAGHGGFREYFRDMNEIWESVSYEPVEVRDLDDRVFVVVTQRLRGHVSGIDVEGKFGIAYEISDEKVTELRS